MDCPTTGWWVRLPADGSATHSLYVRTGYEDNNDSTDLIARRFPRRLELVPGQVLGEVPPNDGGGWHQRATDGGGV